MTNRCRTVAKAPVGGRHVILHEVVKALHALLHHTSALPASRRGSPSEGARSRTGRRRRRFGLFPPRRRRRGGTARCPRGAPGEVYRRFHTDTDRPIAWYGGRRSSEPAPRSCGGALPPRPCRCIHGHRDVTVVMLARAATGQLAKLPSPVMDIDIERSWHCAALCMVGCVRVAVVSRLPIL